MKKNSSFFFFNYSIHWIAEKFSISDDNLTAFLIELYVYINVSYIVKLLVEAAGIADWFAALTPSPEGRRVRLTVAATRPFPPARRLYTEEIDW